RAWIKQIHRGETAGTASAYVLVAEPERRIVGNVMASGIERRHSSAWPSYWIVAAARGAGLTSAALGSFVDHLHDGLGIHRLELGSRPDSPAAAYVAEDAGFLVEGRGRVELHFDVDRVEDEDGALLGRDPALHDPLLRQHV